MVNKNQEKKVSKKLERPHQKNYLMTPLGRFIERASYTDLFIFGFLSIILSSIYFWLAPHHHSLNKPDINILDTLYFSIVTFTSLGYGDLSPIGFGRFIASLVVILGLIFIALLVGKIASERQQSILLLVHTSDCQRRLTNFSSEINELNNNLKIDENLEASLKIAATHLEVIAKYLIFNANQARLITFGNESSLGALYREISDLQSTCIEIHKKEVLNVLIFKRSLALANRCNGVVQQMVFLHKNSIEDKSFSEAFKSKLFGLFRINQPQILSGSMINIYRTSEKMKIEMAVLDNWSKGKVNPMVIENVYNYAPIGPKESWQVGIHKDIAQQLKISNNLVSKCFNILIEQNKLPKLR